jgi:alpha-glucosidase (family GH31 glycosyl hydrolase)
VKYRRISFLFSVAAIGCAAASAGVISRDWSDGKLSLKLDDGAETIEWISPEAFRVARTWGPPIQLSKIAHEKVEPQLEDAGSTLTMRTRFLTVTIDRGDVSMAVASGATPVTRMSSAKTDDGVELRFAMGPQERVFGLMGGSRGVLNIRGEKLEREHGFFFTSAGYGASVRSPARCVFDMANGTVTGAGASSVEYLFYYGPTAKEVLEQHGNARGQSEVKGTALDLLTPDRLPKVATPLPAGVVASWDALAGLVQRMNEWSLSGVVYPALNLASFDSAPKEIRQRAADLSSMFPLVYRTSGEGGIDPATRAEWTPYLLTYLREAYDRGYPLIRPLPMQFSRDENAQSDVFMLGDEVLLAPVVEAGERRKIDLPRGNWTDLRTNREYPGRQTIEVDAPAGRVPAFVRNGWIVPLAEKDQMELHYFPSLGAEFFLWEPDIEENSQFHAAPAGDFVRVEVESKKRRTYEWILHHTGAPRLVEEDSGPYTRVARRALLRPGAWWHDDARNDLHLMMRVEAGTDRIVNMSF